jgi:hypothetical protein
MRFSCFVCFRPGTQHVQWTCVSVTGCFGTNISLEERVSLQVYVHTLSTFEIGEISSILNQPADTRGQYIKPKTVAPKPWQTVSIPRSVGRPTVTRLQAERLRSWGSIPGRSKRFSLLHSVQIGCGTQLASYTMGNCGSFPGGKTAGAWYWSLTSILCRSYEGVRLYLHSPIRLQGVVLYEKQGKRYLGTFTANSDTVFLTLYVRCDHLKWSPIREARVTWHAQ